MNRIVQGADWELPSGQTVHVGQLQLRHLSGMVKVATRAFPKDYPRRDTRTKEWLRDFLKASRFLFPVGVFCEGRVASYLVWQNLGGPGGCDVVEYLQTATHPDFQRRGLGKLLTVAGRILLDQFRDCYGMPPVRTVEVSTAAENPARELYQEWLLDSNDTHRHVVPDVYFGWSELYLVGRVRPYEELLAKLDQAGFHLV